MDTAHTIELTDGEIAVLYALETSQYHDGQDPVGNPVWSTDLHLDTTLPAKSVPGVVSSLSRKGLVECSGGRPADATVCLTKAYRAVKAEVATRRKA
jgi:hypothetical protein